ncbi:MAG: hypothetical protein EOS21_30985 [Mesorhizobium sp.]|nr:MAG: hypothetical protein EOS21_30985 [Mesorhizobium sp.]
MTIRRSEYLRRRSLVKSAMVQRAVEAFVINQHGITYLTGSIAFKGYVPAGLSGFHTREQRERVACPSGEQPDSEPNREELLRSFTS